MLYTGLVYSSFGIDNTSILSPDHVHSGLLLAAQAKAHKPAGMIILQNAVTHSLPARNIFCTLDVVCVIRNRADENHPGFLHNCIIGYAVSPDIVAVLL